MAFIERIIGFRAVLRKGRASPGVAQGMLLVGLVAAAWPGLRALWTTFGPDPSGFVVMVHCWPVLYTTFWFDAALWGGWAPGYHATNVALHAFNACLAWRLLAHFRIPGAWWAAAVFALHPGQVEPVAWIISRKDVLSGTFVLLAVAVWLRLLVAPSGSVLPRRPVEGVSRPHGGRLPL